MVLGRILTESHVSRDVPLPERKFAPENQQYPPQTSPSHHRVRSNEDMEMMAHQKDEQRFSMICRSILFYASTRIPGVKVASSQGCFFNHRTQPIIRADALLILAGTNHWYH